MKVVRQNLFCLSKQLQSGKKVEIIKNSKEVAKRIFYSQKSYQL